ncbi:MAG: zf-HC2 domain-containing protein [Deltaproteobacteria bacterium]|nr:zf-HC2 domain-containing protein [Deltaproteobacteria bacterium]MCB9787193.1 zf-HC2 domain-containing protein [Deltaproteobacteria bacterium]
MSPCDRIRAHLSALADGEMQPLEAIALQRHLASCAGCAAEYEAVAALKVKVHVAAGEVVAPAALRARWRSSVSEAVAARARGPWWAAVVLPAGLAAAAAVLALMLTTPRSEPAPRDEVAVAPVAVAQPPEHRPLVLLDGDALERMARVHRATATPNLLDDLVQAGALLTFERLPADFMNRGLERLRVVRARHVDCDASWMGSSLAVLRADTVDLPDDVDHALVDQGVFVRSVAGLEVRVSRSGDQIFVLLSDPATVSTVDTSI